MTRRFEFVGDGSDKFYELTTSGNEVVVRFGRNGTNGQTTTKSFLDDSAAEKHAKSLVAQKIGKGYIEIT